MVKVVLKGLLSFNSKPVSAKFQRDGRNTQIPDTECLQKCQGIGPVKQVQNFFGIGFFSDMNEFFRVGFASDFPARLAISRRVCTARVSFCEPDKGTQSYMKWFFFNPQNCWQYPLPRVCIWHKADLFGSPPKFMLFTSPEAPLDIIHKRRKSRSAASSAECMAKQRNNRRNVVCRNAHIVKNSWQTVQQAFHQSFHGNE